MDNLSIENTLLHPKLSDGWVLDSTQSPPCICHATDNKRYDVNEIAVMILASCDGIQSVETIIAGLVMQFPEAGSDIPDDVETVLKELHQKQVLTLTSEPPKEQFEVLPKTPPHGKKRLCIGMATYDDYDGVYFSVQAIRLYHPEILNQIELLVIDNHPDGPCAQALKQLEHWVPAYRYVPCERIRGTAVRDFIFREANADYVLCIDSHVMIEGGAIEQLLAYFDAQPDCKDLLQGPLLNDDLRNISTHFNPGWSQGMYGTWGNDVRCTDVDAEAFEIPMQGLGLFACAKDAWPGFNPRFSGFGGEEGYIHEKVRQAGGRTLCLPFLRWLHRFNRPMGTRYTVSWDDRVRNYLIGRDELSLECDDVIAHFNEHIGEANTKTMVDKVRKEIAHPFYYFDAIYCLIDEQEIQSWVAIQRVLDRFGILHRVMPINISDFADDSLLAKVLASREIFNQAEQSGYECIFIFDAQEIPGFEVDASLGQAIAMLKQQAWSVFYPNGRLEPLDQDESVLTSLKGVKTGKDSPIACHRNLYGLVLEAIPEGKQEAGQWLSETGGLASFYDQYIDHRFAPA